MRRGTAERAVGNLSQTKLQRSLLHFYIYANLSYSLGFTLCQHRCVQVSPSREDAIFQACGLTAEPAALVAGRTAAGQRGTRRW